MAEFCSKCGAPVPGAFCPKCGADMRNPSAPQPGNPAPSPQAVAPAVVSPAPPTAASPKKMSGLAKLGIAAVVLIFVGGALAVGGVYYVAHRVSQKFHEETDGILNSSSDSRSGDSSNSSSRSGASSSASSGIDACKLLSKEDVSAAIGVEIIRTEPGENSCSYIAKGDQAEMTAKHTTAMMASRGADKKTQQIIQNITGGMFKQFQSESHEKQDTAGEVPVLNFSVDQKNAEEQMRLNAKMLGTLGAAVGIPGVGDQAFISGDSMMLVRKGKSLVRIMYMTCPCGTEAVTPLAKEIADAL